MYSRAELKSHAKRCLSGKWKNAGLVTFIVLAALIVVSFITSVLSTVSTFLSEKELTKLISSFFLLALTISVIPLILGFVIFFVNLAKNDSPKISNIFDGYKKSLINSISLGILTELYTFLWSLLLIVPGIIKGISYSMSYYIMAENPKISANEAIRQSKEMMEGHKLDYFILQFSFLGWMILSCLSLGIGFIFLIPYITTTTVKFYLEIKNDFVPVEERNDGVVLEQF